MHPPLLPPNSPEWTPPPHLDPAANEMWRVATGAVMSPDTCLARYALHIREVLRQESRMIELRRERDMLRATIAMACDRLGGTVEGQPPNAGNFLQRIDELRQQS